MVERAARQQGDQVGRSLSLPVYLGNMASECAALARGTEALQFAMAEILALPGVSLDSTMVRNLQDLDRITQTLAALSDLNAVAAAEFEDQDIFMRTLADAKALPSVLERVFQE